MKSNFNECLARVLKHEGGYTNDPADSGGATNFGITITDYKKYIKSNGTSTDVKNMKLDDAKRIYKTKYWDALGCDNLSNGVDYTCFDYGVNSGLQRPRNVLSKFKDLSGNKLIDAINDERMSFLHNLAVRRPKDQRFLKGWTTRVSQVRAYSHALADKKTDVVSGPVAGTVVGGLSFWAIAQNFITSHPYLTAAGGVAIGALAWWIIHTIRNRK